MKVVDVTKNLCLFAKKSYAGRKADSVKDGTQYSSTAGAMSAVQHFAILERLFSFKMGFSRTTSDFRKKKRAI